MAVIPHAPRHRRRRSWPLALVVAFGGLAASTTGALVWQHSVEKARVRRIDNAIAASVDAVTSSFTDLSREARESVDFFSPRNPDRGGPFEWATRFAAAQTTTPGMSAILYVDRVADADLAAYEVQFRREVGESAKLVPVGGSDHEFLARGQPTEVLGVDLRILPAVQPLLDAAAASTEAVLELAPKEVVAALPIDTPGQVFLIGLADRDGSGNVIGWGVASFSGPRLTNVAHNEMPSDFGVTLEADIRGETVVVGTLSARGAIGPDVVRSLDIPGLDEQIVVRITPSAVVHDRFFASGPLGLVISGAGFTLVLALAAFVMTGSRSRALQMVDQATAELSASERRLASLVDHAADALAIVDDGLVVRFITPSVEPLLGVAVDEAVGAHLSTALPFENASAVCEDLVALAPGQSSASERVLQRADGTDLVAEVTLTNLVHDRAVTGYVLTIHDVTDRKLYEQVLHDAAARDPLTGLPNRSRLPVVVETVREGAHRRAGTYVVLYVDLDRFKDINDDHGHGVGDDVLRIVAARLASAVRPVDTVFRVGGDEFVVICPAADRSTGRVVASRIEAAVNEPISVAGLDLSVGASIGVVVGEPGDDPADLLLAADRAMYQEKAARRA